MQQRANLVRITGHGSMPAVTSAVTQLPHHPPCHLIFDCLSETVTILAGLSMMPRMAQIQQVMPMQAIIRLLSRVTRLTRHEYPITHLLQVLQTLRRSTSKPW